MNGECGFYIVEALMKFLQDGLNLRCADNLKGVLRFDEKAP